MSLAQPTLAWQCKHLIFYTNKLDKSNEFYHLFMEIGPNLAEGISYTNTNNVIKFLKNKNKSGFRFTEIQEESVSQIIRNLPNKNSYGFDGISSKLLKLIEPEIVKHLTLLNSVTSFGSSIVGGEQSDWLVSKVQVHQCRVKHKHNIEPWIVIENPIGILFI